MEALQDLPAVGISTGRVAKLASWSPTDPVRAEAAGYWGAGRWERSYRLEGTEECPYHTPKGAWAFL